MEKDSNNMVTVDGMRMEHEKPDAPLNQLNDVSNPSSDAEHSSQGPVKGQHGKAKGSISGKYWMSVFVFIYSFVNLSLREFVHLLICV